jgi:phosphatidylglycerophosphate synthase
MMTSVAAHARVNDGLLADLEKRALVAMARRLPTCINSDHLTLVGLLAMVGAGACFWISRWHPAALAGFVVMLALNWFGDSLDGTLARVRGRLRPRYGYYVDHVIDLVGISCLLAGMALSGHMSALVAAGVAAAYALASAEVFLATHAQGTFRLAFARVGPTELRVILAAGALRLAWGPWVTLFGQPYRLFDIGGVVAIAGLLTAFVVSALRNTRALYLAERLDAGE